jgi:hypothetical protein
VEQRLQRHRLLGAHRRPLTTERFPTIDDSALLESARPLGSPYPGFRGFGGPVNRSFLRQSTWGCQPIIGSGRADQNVSPLADQDGVDLTGDVPLEDANDLALGAPFEVRRSTLARVGDRCSCG